MRKALYVGYVAVVISVLALIWRFSPVVYEVNATVSIRPGLYAWDNDKPSLRVEQAVRSQVGLLESEGVIRTAIGKVGAGSLSSTDGWFPFSEPVSREDRALIVAKRNLNLRFEPFTDLIRIAFRHGDQMVAVHFTNALIQSFIDRYHELYSNSSAVSFFLEQQKHSTEAFARSSAALADFATANRIHRVEEQQRLLLEQRSRLASALFTTKGSIEEKKGQVSAIPDQLSHMRPIGQLPQVAALVKGKVPPAGNAKQPPIDKLASDPPLLLVRVYQDTIASLVKLQTELAGLQALEASQELMLKKIDDELSRLSKKQAEFERLRLEVNHAKQSSEAFTNKALELKLSQELSARNLSSVQIVQAATLPFRPIWPRPGMLLIIAGILCIAPPAAFAIYSAAAARSREPHRVALSESDAFSAGVETRQASS